MIVENKKKILVPLEIVLKRWVQMEGDEKR